MDDFAWVESNGGPLIVVSTALLAEWEGADPPTGGREVVADFRWKPDGPATDYDRAADIAHASTLGTLPVGRGTALVLGDEPYATTWVPFEAGRGGILVRWDYAPDDTHASTVLARVPAAFEWRHEFVFASRPGEHVLFDSAFPGIELPTDRLMLDLLAGRYIVASARFQPDDDTSFVLHRLIPG